MFVHHASVDDIVKVTTHYSINLCKLSTAPYHIVQAIIDVDTATYGVLFHILAGDPDGNAQLDVPHLHQQETVSQAQTV